MEVAKQFLMLATLFLELAMQTMEMEKEMQYAT